MFRASSYNISDQTPSGMRDLNFINSIDAEEFTLFGISTIYYKISARQENYDSTFRDVLSSKSFDEPIQLRSFFKVDESTTHGMGDIGSGQNAERTGTVWFNVALIEKLLGRSPILGDVVENVQIHQKFEIFGISKEMHRLGYPLRYKCSIRLYQDSK